MAGGFSRGAGVSALVAIATLSFSSPTWGEKVGVAAAVNPDAFSSLSGSPQSQLNIGKSIFYNERINTTTSGLVQVLLVDGSTFTVGPGSDLTIDKFVYDPKKKTGQVVATFSKGVMRFVGGKISKNPDGVTIKTPSGALAIRGGVAQGNGKIWSFIYGVEMVWKGNNGQKVSVYEAGYTLDLTGGAPKVRPTTAADTNSIMATLTNHNTGATGTNGNGGQQPNKPTQYTVTETVSLQDLIADATSSKIEDTVQQKEKNDPPGNSVPPANNTPPPADTPPPANNTPPPANNTPPPANNTPPPDNTPPPGNNTPPPMPEATGGTPGGYAAGYERESAGKDSPVAGTLQGVSFIAEDNKLLFGLNGHSGDVVGIKFTDGQAKQDSITVSRGNQQATMNGSQASLSAKPEPLCTNCGFLKWGTWDAHLNYNYEETDENGKTKKIDLTNLFASGWWVTGDVTSVGDLDKLAILNATATYNGSAWGTVDNLGKTYDASGALRMNWSFADRRGDLTISNFDRKNFNDGLGLTFSGPMCAPGALCGPQQHVTAAGNHFGGPLSGQLPGDLGSLSGSAAGSFVNNGIAAGGVMGNWNVDSASYHATGIFGGLGTLKR